MDSVVVSPTHRPGFSRMNLVASGEREALSQIIRQLAKLVDVVHVADHFRARSVDLTEDTITFEATGKSAKLNAFQLMLEKYGILESVRSGKLIMARGRKTT